MKTLPTYIKDNGLSLISLTERLIVNKNTKHINDKVLFDIENISNNEEMYDVVEYIAKSGKKDPDIWDDSEEFAARDYFEPWEDDFGKSDDMYEVIERWCDDNVVVGWKTDNGFDELDKIAPDFFNIIINSWEQRTVHKQMNCTADVWEKRLGKYECTLLKLNMHVNYDGNESKEYWYMFILERKG